MNSSFMWTCLAVGAMAVLLAGGARAGEAPLQGLVLTTDRTVDTTSTAAIVKAVIKDGMNEQQKSYALWRFFIQRNMHKEAAPQEEGGNAAELMTKTAYALCGTWGDHYARLATEAALTASSVYLNGHVIAATQYWGDWHAYDVDMDALYAKADGVIASPGEIRRAKDAQGKYLLRGGAPVKSYPWYLGPDSIAGVVGLYDKAGVNEPYKPRQPKWVYDLRLRKGVQIVWAWVGPIDDVGFVTYTHLPKELTSTPFNSLREYLESDFDYYRQEKGKLPWSWGYRRGGLRPNPLGSWNGVGGNGRVIFDLSAGGFKDALLMAESAENVQVKDGKLALSDPAKPGSLVLDFSLPYCYGDAWIDKPLPEKGVKVELSLDGKGWREVYPKGGLDDGKRIRLFDFVRGQPKFWLKLTLEKDSAPLAAFKATGAFHCAATALPALLKAKNQVSVRLTDAKALADAPLYVTYVYDQVDDSHKIMRRSANLAFTADNLTRTVDTGQQHWPLMREMWMRCGTPTPAEEPAEESGELDWGNVPWEWVYHGVNFWNDFERGDRQGWAGQITPKNPAGGDLCLDNSLKFPDGKRQLKIIRFGCFLNRDSKFRCQLFVKNVGKLKFYTAHQDETVDGRKVLYEKDFTAFKDGAWQALEVAMNELASAKEPAKKMVNNVYLANSYMQVWPAEGKDEKDVEFMIDDVVCWDGQLKADPLKDPDAPAKALADDPIWNARPPTTRPATGPATAPASAPSQP